MLTNSLVIRYILVGILNTLFGYSVFSILVFTGVHYVLALFFATLIGCLFNFRTYGLLVFKNGEWRLLAKFICCYLLLYLLNTLSLYVLLLFTPNIYLANAMAVLCIATVGYFLNRGFVYENN